MASANIRARAMRKTLSGFAKWNGIVLKKIPNVALRVLRQDIPKCENMQLGGTKPTQQQKTRYNNELMKNLMESLFDSTDVYCSNSISDEFLEQVVCGEESYNSNPSIVIALDNEYNKKTSTSNKRVLGFAIWGKFTNRVYIGNDENNRQQIQLISIPANGKINANNVINHDTLAEISLICAGNPSGKPVGRAIMAYCIWDIYKRKRGGHRQFSGIHLTVAAPDANTSENFIENVKDGQAFKLYHQFGFKKIAAVKNNTTIEYNGVGTKYPEFHMLLYWGANGDKDLEDTFDEFLEIDSDLKEICQSSPMCFP